MDNRAMKCRACGSDTDFLFMTRDWNRNVSEQNFEYRICNSCGLIFLANVPDDLERYYGSEYYRMPRIEKVRKVARAEQYQLEMIRRFVKSGRLLEVGPGFGVFACQAKQARFDVDVIEKEASCCEFLEQKVGVNAIRSNEPHTVLRDRQPYDAIALWHVIEHLPSPWEFLDVASHTLTADGVLLIAAPNPDAFQFRLMGAQWPHVDAPRHLWLIPVSLLQSYLGSRGFELIFASFDDKGARSWNRFGWQRALMNKLSNPLMKKAAYVAGIGVGAVMSRGDRSQGKGSAYTVIFRKKRG